VCYGADDIDAETFKKCGIKEIRKIVEDTNKPKDRVCGECNFVNNESSDYCSKCGYPLTEPAIAKHKKDKEEVAHVIPEVYRKKQEDQEAIIKRMEARLKQMESMMKVKASG
jgi:ribosomal protein L40E